MRRAILILLLVSGCTEREMGRYFEPAHREVRSRCVGSYGYGYGYGMGPNGKMGYNYGYHYLPCASTAYDTIAVADRMVVRIQRDNWFDTTRYERRGAK